MDKLEIAINLLQRVQDDKKRQAAKNKELEKAGRDWAERLRIENRYRHVLSKTQMNDSLKMARRLIGESYI